MNVNDPSPAVTEMAADWPMVDALMQGTRAMRSKGTALMPRWPAEEQDAYAARLSQATLFPAFRRTVGVMVGKPFSKELTFGDDVPARIVDLCQDCDLQGRSLHVFAVDVATECMAKGISGVLVEYPRVASGVRTQADEARVGARPYLVHVKAGQVLGWRTEPSPGGATRLVQLRLMETVEEPEGEFGTKDVPQVRVLEPGRVRLFREGKEGKFVEVDSWFTTMTEIPFVPFYGFRKAFMVGEGPLTDLAYLNVKHWQSQSDQDWITHVARVPILVTVGAEHTDVIVGASTAIKLPENADMKYVEHTGAAIDAGRQSLDDLEDQMRQTGAELLVLKSSGPERSATEASNDADANKSDLQRISEGFEDSLDQVLQFMADWLKLPRGGHVELFKEFGLSSLSDAMATLILSAQSQGLISKETALNEFKRRGILSAEVDPEAEAERVQQDGPVLGLMDDGQRKAA